MDTIAARSARDVCMRGFRSRMPVEEVLAWVDACTVALDSEALPLEALYNRVLACDVTAGLSLPPFDRAAMDGYALRGAETVGAGPYNPLPFAVQGQVLAGQAFRGELPPGTALRIMTGAPIPAGADAVLPAEHADEVAGRVEVTAAVAPGANIVRRGEDVAEGAALLCAGAPLRPQDLGMLAAAGIDSADVVRRPRVRIVVTGNELIVPGQARGPCQVYDANSAMLRALVCRDGGLPQTTAITADDRAAIRQAVGAPGADLVLLAGGSSIGSEDHAAGLLAEEGELAIHGVALRPGGAAGMGRLGSMLVFLLPGNPVSALAAYDFFAGRAVRRLAGRPAAWPYCAQDALVARKLVSAPGRVDYCRVRLVDGQVEPVATGAAARLASATRADGVVIIPAESEGSAPGAWVRVYRYGGEL